ncbi:hypothetical protein [Novosphingobium decolorationis]|uniref:Uncharacterized protein n=1 Tax=Novosphingobium decolorationis TaxID=2698673 RepID=A0ABX8E8L1_9SPHN|nr:hypothetical protein [Novosphingobium decolorationis]QVM85178.1 hypothetical protein HT578_17075 [Novosphingobium decolorationis]
MDMVPGNDPARNGTAPDPFAQYPAQDVFFEDAPVEPILEGGDPPHRRYITALRAAGREMPDFAGHYRVVHYGCGTMCGSAKFLDRRSGRILDLPAGLARYSPDLMHTAASRLLRVRDALEGAWTRCRFTDLVLEDGQFRTVAQHDGPCSEDA